MCYKDQRGLESHKPQIVLADDKFCNMKILKLKFQELKLESFAHFCCDGEQAVTQVKEIVNQSLINAKSFPV